MVADGGGRRDVVGQDQADTEAGGERGGLPARDPPQRDPGGAAGLVDDVGDVGQLGGLPRWR
ncbi:MAG TPA: hypothetical protein VGD91_21220 [Trebonia sp.]